MVMFWLRGKYLSPYNFSLSEDTVAQVMMFFAQVATWSLKQKSC